MKVDIVHSPLAWLALTGYHGNSTALIVMVLANGQSIWQQLSCENNEMV